MKSQDIIQSATSRVMEQLQMGVNPWRSIQEHPNGKFSIPSNPKTQADYQGINIPILWNAAAEAGYKTNLWLSRTQAKELGGKIKTGQQGTHVVIYKPLGVNDNKARNRKRIIPVMKTFVVFNLEQIEGLEHLLPPPKVSKILDSIHIAEEILHQSGAKIFEGSLQTFYLNSDDIIALPNRFLFKATEDFYVTALHELIHWTGHECRLNRFWGKQFGDQAYSFEELVAEMGSSFLSAKLGLKGALQHASYIDIWVKILWQDNRALFKAISQAQEAFEYLYALVAAAHTEVEVLVAENPEPIVAEPASVTYAVAENRQQTKQPHVLLPSGLRRTPKRLMPPIAQGILFNIKVSEG